MNWYIGECAGDVVRDTYYEFLMRDSLSKIGKGHAVHEGGEEGLQRHITNTVSFFLWRVEEVGKGIRC